MLWDSHESWGRKTGCFHPKRSYCCISMPREGHRETSKAQGHIALLIRGQGGLGTHQPRWGLAMSRQCSGQGLVHSQVYPCCLIQGLQTVRGSVSLLKQRTWPWHCLVLWKGTCSLLHVSRNNHSICAPSYQWLLLLNTGRRWQSSFLSPSFPRVLSWMLTSLYQRLYQSRNAESNTIVC